MFARDYKSWGAVNLKEWIDSYESSRFTLVAYDMAVITSEYNMAHIEEWLRKNTPILSIENTIWAMYKLFIGFRKLGEFPTILEAKKYAQDSKLTGFFSLLGENYSDQWYVPVFCGRNE